jgi:SUMO ligase MMS21 Smc5/6 complex component
MNICDKFLVFKNSLENSIKCNICLKYLDDPVVCNCSHYFCYSCIQKVGDNFRCIVCKQVILVDTVKRSPFNNDFVKLTINILNKIESNNTRQFVKNRKRKKLSQSSISDTEKLPEIVQFNKKPINFILKGTLRGIF